MLHLLHLFKKWGETLNCDIKWSPSYAFLLLCLVIRSICFFNGHGLRHDSTSAGHVRFVPMSWTRKRSCEAIICRATEASVRSMAALPVIWKWCWRGWWKAITKWKFLELRLGDPYFVFRKCFRQKQIDFFERRTMSFS